MRNWILLATISLCASCSSNSHEMASTKFPEALSQSNEPPKQQEPPQASSTSSETASDIPLMQKAIEDIATELDPSAVDGWFYGQDPRFFKSFYRKIPSKRKADFAVAYHEWISQFHEDLVKDFKSYVPYKKRADFAFEWWSKNEPQFNKETLKMQVLWAHEAIQDAGELWWRAEEKLHPETKRFEQTVAHDEEQKMLAQFRENQDTPGRISDQIWKREKH